MVSFTLVEPREGLGYEPIEDLNSTIEIICNFYFPDHVSGTLTHEHTGVIRRMNRAMKTGSFADYKSAVDEYNDTLQKCLVDGTIARTLAEKEKALPLELVERILNQIYQKIVSPAHKRLSKYENGTSNVYGELLPLFTHTIFQETKLRSDQVFLDLGSGVGNVVLQAALEVGCESWGIEQMKNPSDLGQLQHQEFKARCQRWSVKPGKVRLIEGDFLANPEIDAVIRRADVILINNEVFTPDLNNAIAMKLLDVKEGGRIVSLKSFVPSGWEMKARNMEDPRNLLSVERKQYYSEKYVSWTGKGGEYFIATVDSSRLRRFRKRQR
jgi:H3 lysine-79-specific histone-lysine N-methyltransferase